MLSLDGAGPHSAGYLIATDLAFSRPYHSIHVAAVQLYGPLDSSPFSSLPIGKLALQTRTP
jgi:hypothetical protein